MKKNILIYILLSQINILVAQDSCDPTLPICDSVFIDSIVFAELPSTGNHVIFQVTTEHHFLYAPNFVICSDSNIDFLIRIMDTLASMVQKKFRLCMVIQI